MSCAQNKKSALYLAYVHVAKAAKPGDTIWCPLAKQPPALGQMQKSTKKVLVALNFLSAC